MLDGTELKKRKMTVKPSRSKKGGPTSSTHGATPATASDRLLRLKGLPPRAQEGLLEQSLVKQIGAGKVKRVEIFEDSGEALVELESAADAGIVLLRAEALNYDDEHVLNVQAEEVPLKPPQATTTPAAEPSTTGFKPRPPKSKAPKTSAKRRLGVVSAVNTATPANAEGEDVAMAETSAPVPKGQDDFRKMLLGGK